MYAPPDRTLPAARHLRQDLSSRSRKADSAISQQALPATGPNSRVVPRISNHLLKKRIALVLTIIVSFSVPALIVALVLLG